jgi:DNA-binding phage protein
MKTMKMPTSDSYTEFLIESLKDIEHAAHFIEAILEEEDPEPELLRNALRKVVEAHFRSNHQSPKVSSLYQQFDKILTESGCAEIYAFVQFLDAMGLKIAIAPLAPEPLNLTPETENNPETVTA